jgi:hypothetical protein
VREGRAALGTGLKEFASRGVPWIIEASGFDDCMIGREHGALDLETIAQLAGWFQATNVSAIVRIHKVSPFPAMSKTSRWKSGNASLAFMPRVFPGHPYGDPGPDRLTGPKSPAQRRSLVLISPAS